MFLIFILFAFFTRLVTSNQPTLEHLPFELRYKLLHEHGLTVHDRANIGASNRLLSLELDGGRVTTRINKTIQEMKSKCHDMNIYPFNGFLSGEHGMMVFFGEHPEADAWLECYRHVFENVDVFMPVKSILFVGIAHARSQDGREKIQARIDGIMELIEETARENQVFREGLESFSQDSTYYRVDEVTKRFYCRFVQVFEVFPNIKHVPFLYYPSGDDSTAIAMRTCAQSCVEGMKDKKRVETVRIQYDSTDGIPLLIDPEFGIFTWPSLKTIHLSFEEGDPITRHVVEAVLRIKRELSVVMLVMGGLDITQELFIAANIKRLEFRGDLGNSSVIQNMTTALGKRTSGLKEFNIKPIQFPTGVDTIFVTRMTRTIRHLVRRFPDELEVLSIPITHHLRFEGFLEDLRDIVALSTRLRVVTLDVYEAGLHRLVTEKIGTARILLSLFRGVQERRDPSSPLSIEVSSGMSPGFLLRTVSQALERFDTQKMIPVDITLIANSRKRLKEPIRHRLAMYAYSWKIQSPKVDLGHTIFTLINN